MEDFFKQFESSYEDSKKAIDFDKKKMAAKILKDRQQIKSQKGKFILKRRFPFAKQIDRFFIYVKMWWYRLLRRMVS